MSRKHKILLLTTVVTVLVALVFLVILIAATMQPKKKEKETTNEKVKETAINAPEEQLLFTDSDLELYIFDDKGLSLSSLDGKKQTLRGEFSSLDSIKNITKSSNGEIFIFQMDTQFPLGTGGYQQFGEMTQFYLTDLNGDHTKIPLDSNSAKPTKGRAFPIGFVEEHSEFLFYYDGEVKSYDLSSRTTVTLDIDLLSNPEISYLDHGKSYGNHVVLRLTQGGSGSSDHLFLYKNGKLQDSQLYWSNHRVGNPGFVVWDVSEGGLILMSVNQDHQSKRAQYFVIQNKNTGGMTEIDIPEDFSSNCCHSLNFYKDGVLITSYEYNQFGSILRVGIIDLTDKQWEIKEVELKGLTNYSLFDGIKIDKQGNNAVFLFETRNFNEEHNLTEICADLIHLDLELFKANQIEHTCGDRGLDVFFKD